MVKRVKQTLVLLLVFLLGAFSTALYGATQTPKQGEVQLPRSEQINFKPGYPGDEIKESQILVYNDRVILDVQDAQWAKFTDTKSMEPTFGATSNAIEKIPSSEDDLHVGDIASYHSTIDGGIIIHRIVYKGSDEQGTYFIFKGDNNPSSDPEKVRFDQVQRQVIAIIY